MGFVPDLGALVAEMAEAEVVWVVWDSSESFIQVLDVAELDDAPNSREL